MNAQVVIYICVHQQPEAVMPFSVFIWPSGVDKNEFHVVCCKLENMIWQISGTFN